MSKSFQSFAVQTLSIDCKVSNLASELHEKVKITLQPFAPFDIPNQWGEEVLACLSRATSYIKTWWLKTIAGAWCTSVRLHTYEGRGCIFGCLDSEDTICHHLVCPSLWQLARETLRIQETSIMFLPRLCIIQPSLLKFKTLAFCHALYHQCVNDLLCIGDDGMMRSPQRVQHRASELSNFCLHLVGGRDLYSD